MRSKRYAFASIVAFMMLGFFTSVSADEPIVPQHAEAIVLSVEIPPADLGVEHRIPKDFLGISTSDREIDAGNVYTGDNTTLIRMFKLLGGGVLRSAGRDPPIKSLPKTADAQGVRRLANFMKLTGWTFIAGLPLKSSSPDLPAFALRKALIYRNAFEPDVPLFYAIGNEPDMYFENSSIFLARWQSIHDAVVSNMPEAKFAGPDITWLHPGWLEDFSRQQGSKVSFLSSHYYGGLRRLRPSWSQLLNGDRVASAFDVTSSIAAADGRKVRLTELNSVAGSGLPGVSNSSRSALWGVVALIETAKLGFTGVNLHKGPSEECCFSYNPFNKVAGKWKAEPVFYSLLMFRGMLDQAIIPSKSSASSLRHLATMDRSGSIKLLLASTDLSKPLNVTLPVRANDRVSVLRLDTGPSSWDPTTLGSAQVDEFGTWSPRFDIFVVRGAPSVLTIPVGGAVLVEINRGN